MSQTTKRAKRGRRTVARHGALRSPHPATLLLKVLGIMLGVVLVSGAGVAAYAAYDLTASFTSDAVALEGQPAVPPAIGAIEGGINLLLTGTDECAPEFADAFGDRCSGDDASGELNDVNMLLHISDEPRRVTVVSFPRDLMVELPSCTGEDGSETGGYTAPLNAAFAEGGLSCVVNTISSLTGLNIPFAAKVNFGGVMKITDAIGGVEVCIGNGGIKDEYTGIDWPAGMRTVQGMDALQFLRTRHGLENGSDLARIANQQQYMSKLARKLVSDETLGDPATLYKLATTAVENVTPSQSLTNPLTLVQIALAVKSVPFEDITFVQYPVFDDPDETTRVLPDQASAEQLWAAFAANQPVQITHDVNSGGGVVSADPQGDGAAAPAPTDSVQLSQNIPGQTAADATCSAGNVQG